MGKNTGRSTMPAEGGAKSPQNHWKRRGLEWTSNIAQEESVAIEHFVKTNRNRMNL